MRKRISILIICILICLVFVLCACDNNNKLISKLQDNSYCVYVQDEQYDPLLDESYYCIYANDTTSDNNYVVICVCKSETDANFLYLELTKEYQNDDDIIVIQDKNHVFYGYRKCVYDAM